MAEADFQHPEPQKDAAMANQPDENAEATPSATAAPPERKTRRLVVMISVPLLLVIAATAYWISLQGKVSTDNAYVKQDAVGVASEVAGKIVEVAVTENQTVKAGDLLFRVDPEPYMVKIQQTTAAIAEAQSNVTALQNDEALSGSEISGAREDIAFAQSRLARQQALWNRGFTTKADLDAASHAVAQAREELRGAEARAQEARAKLAHGAAVPGENAQVAAARAEREQAQLDLRRTTVTAPIAGRIAQADRLQNGQMAVTSLPMVTIISEASSYVEANFKETQLDDMRVGQPAEIELDAYPGLTLKGRVLSIGSGTGSEFSILPAQNATGNWVKVTQRVPVRIAITDKSPRRLIAGLSATVTVFTDKGTEKAN
ncbi:MAG: HlyD family secretion protein [Novosphingobium sp.]|nr:HlyD family secretion protein [Novosphingobium sp.]